MKFIKDLCNLSRFDATTAGGKGASLGELMQAGLPVPSGFVILTTAFEEFLKKTNLDTEIDSILKSVDSKKMLTLKNASAKIKSLILQKEIPLNIADKIIDNFKSLNVKYVAVRSSSTVEDSVNASWAGQLESYLNTTDKNLLENVKKCWASLYSPRAISYRFTEHLREQKIFLAVVVQKMVESEVSGTAFSIHPVTQNKRHLIIEAGFGLGEAVVSGQITPDSYIVEKNSWKILEQNINIQKRKIVRSKFKNNEWETLTRNKRKARKLSDNEIRKLAKLVVRLERHFRFPVDIEWAKEKDKFYLTQCRPITTLQSIKSEKQDIFDYIESQKWFFGVRAEESLFFYSAKYLNREKLIWKYYKSNFVETLLFPLKSDYLVRVFNLAQAKRFHLESLDKIKHQPEILLKFIKLDQENWQEIDKLSSKLKKQIEPGNFMQSRVLFLKLLDNYSLYGNFFNIIFSQGMVMTQQKELLDNRVASILKRHDTWRNNVAFEEEKLGQVAYLFITMLIEQKKLSFSPAKIMKYLTAAEVIALANSKLNNREMKKIIQSRRKHGYIFAYLHDKNYQEVIENPLIVPKIRAYFKAILKNEKKNTGIISGMSTFIVPKKIKAKVVVLEDKNKLAKNNLSLKGKILVSIQTTPHFIPYLKDVKGIITDEGGITCHAAIVSREFKIPCIVGTKNATEVLKNGDWVELDTKEGIIQKI